MVSPSKKRAANAHALREPFWNEHSDTGESGRWKPPVDQSQDGSEPESRVQLAFSVYTPKPQDGAGERLRFYRSLAAAGRLLRAITHCSSSFSVILLQVASEVMLSKWAVQAAL